MQLVSCWGKGGGEERGEEEGLSKSCMAPKFRERGEAIQTSKEEKHVMIMCYYHRPP